ncbi:hypothetical protein BH10BAC1_BH10BAC1_07720 [soil metagenome]
MNFNYLSFMNIEIFQLDFTRTMVLMITIIPVIINLGIFIYVSLKIQRTRVTGYFSFYVFSLGMWQLCEGFVKMSITSETASKWNRMGLFFLLFVLLFGLLFSVYYTKLNKKISWNVLFLAIVLPVIFFVFCNIAKLDAYTIVPSGDWYWIANPSSASITNLIFSWITIVGFLPLIILWNYSFTKGKNSLERKQSLLLAIGFTIPTIIGIVVEIIFPLIFNMNAIPLTATFATVFSVMAFVGIKKYQLLDFSPKYKWEEIVETMNEGILIVDLSEKIKYANKAFCNLLGYDFEEIRECSTIDLFLNSKEEKRKMKHRFIERKRNKSEHYEIEMRTKTGEIKWFSIGASPFYSKEGNIIGSIGIHADITDRKIAEENLILSNNELEIFIYKASNDLRGPLASIIGLVNISKAEITDEVANQYLSMIESSTQKLDYTLKELVKTMKIKDTERFDDKINFEELIETKLSEFEYYTNFKRLTISKQISVFENFYSNRFLIETIFHNLIENAIKYQSSSESQPYLKISVVEQEDFSIHIVIEDNGIGIRSSLQGLVFDMYYKAVETSKGPGLGLYLVKKCTEKLKGEIELKSSHGKGSIFTILLKNKATYLNKI